MNSNAGLRRIAGAASVAVSLGLLAISATAVEQQAGSRRPELPPQSESRHFDARSSQKGNVPAAAADTRQSALAELRERMPDLAVEVDDTTGATRTLWNRGGYLTGAAAGSHQEIADRYIAEHLPALGLFDSDVAERELTDSVYSDVSGATHLYYRQRVHGVPVYNTQLHVNVNRDGRIISVNNSFLPDAEGAYNTLQPALDPAGAVRAAADHLAVAAARVSVVGTKGAGAARITELRADNLSTEPVKARVMLLPIRRGEARLVWNFAVHTLDAEHAFDFTVDAESGAVWTRFDWVASDQYKVYAAPAESPNHVSPAPPADSRVTVVTPANATASPFGWHDTNGVAGAEHTIMRGNNAHAYIDATNTGLPPAVEPDCGGSLNCSFAIDLTQAPNMYEAAAVTNLFYWTNIIHDVQYKYGFNEAAGNFQVNNYGRGGIGNDDVRAEAQDARDQPASTSTRNNANFLTPGDGARPRMQMYVWDAPNPDKDGDLDASIIVHEYGHGISNRIVGGPSNVSCLSNSQQMGEGISDFLALVYTATSGDAAAQTRGIGTYALNQPTNGAGIRGTAYSTNNGINNWTYASVAGKSVPHGVGAVWAQGMWEVYWALVGQHGFSTDLYNATGTAGNQRAMLYLNEGMKNTPCSPTFTQIRDGILQAAADLHGGADVCRIWTAFAGFGLGVDAVSGGPQSTAPVNGFLTPAACGGTGRALSVGDGTLVEGNSGTANMTFAVTLDAAAATEVRVRYATTDSTASVSQTVSSSGAITIPSSGQASVYPSEIAVSGVSGTIQNLRVRLDGFSHSWVADVDMLLVGPSGQKLVLMSDAGGSFGGFIGATMTFQDGAPLLTSVNFGSGTYAPTNRAPDEVFPVPAPAGPYATVLAAFDGTNPNGTWSLYVFDDEGGDGGAITSWSLLLNTTAHDYAPKTGELVFPAGTTSQTINISVNGDTAVEGDETLSVDLSGASGATIADGHAVGTIIDDDGAPGAATLLSPLTTTVATTSPTYTWQAVATSTWYQLWVNDTTGNVIQQWYTAAQAGCAAASTCSVTPTTALATGSVSWWIRTWNDAGNGPWSSHGMFSVAAPAGVSPIGPSGLAASTRPTYSWNPTAGATDYYLWVNDSTGTVIQRWYTASAAGCADAVSVCRVTPTTALALGAAQFWIQTWNPVGYGPWSAASNFTVPPLSVAATWPVAGAAANAVVRLWAQVVNHTGSAVPAGSNVWFRVTLPDGTASWVGFQSAQELGAGATSWFWYDWTMPAGSVAGAYQYEAQVWAASGAQSAASAPRDFTVGFNHQFNTGSIAPWAATSGSWTSSSNAYMMAPGVTNKAQLVGYGTAGTTFRTVDYSVRMWRDGCTTCANRVIVRGTASPLGSDDEWGSGYYFQYRAGGSYSVYKFVGGSPVALQPWTSSGAIVTGAAWNLLRVVAHNSTLAFYINGTLVWSGTDATLSSGQVGTGFFTLDGATSTLWIDYATLTDPLVTSFDAGFAPADAPPGAGPPGSAGAGKR